MKTYAEILERRKTLEQRGREFQERLLKDLFSLEEDIHSLREAKADYDRVYGYSVTPNSQDEITINLRQAINDELKNAVLLIDGIAEIHEDDRYTLYVRKGAAFGWGEIKTKFEDAYGKLTEPHILASQKLNEVDPPTADVDEKETADAVHAE